MLQDVMLKSSDNLDQQWLTVMQSKEAQLLLVRIQYQMQQSPPTTLALLNSFQLGEPCSVETFCFQLLDHYKTVRVTTGNTGINQVDNPENIKITNVKVFKSANISRHETVLFTLNRSIYFVADRNVELSQIPRCLLSKGKPAVDAITRVPTDQLQGGTVFGRRHLVWETDFGDHGTTLLGLAFILDAISRSSRTYNVTKHNCIWYSKIIQQLLVLRRPLYPVVSQDSSGTWFWLRHRFTPTLEAIEHISALNMERLDAFSEHNQLQHSGNQLVSAATL